MTLSTGQAPRTPDEHDARAAEILAVSPGQRVRLDRPGDGWRATGLKLAGAVPEAAAGADDKACEAALARLGLGPLGHPLPPPPEDAPLVTILVCTFNRLTLLPEAIASARAQRWPVEIVVVDDGSTDGTSEWLSRQPDLRVLRQEPNQGKPAALNRGIEAAAGAAVWVLDDDDALLPGAVAVLARALFARPDLDAVLSDTVCFSGPARTPRGARLALRLPVHKLAVAPLTQVPAMPGATLVRLSTQRRLGPYDPRLNMLEDMDMFLRLGQRGRMACLPVPTQLYRLHDGARGGAQDRLDKRDRASFQRKRIERARPVFRERWRDRSPVQDRVEGHGWALGLKLRGLHAEAAREADRWPPPHSLAEARVRRHLGLPVAPPTAEGTLVVVHDGEVGALADALARHHDGQALAARALHAIEGEDHLDLLWPLGRDTAATGLSGRVGWPAPWSLRLTSAPEWAPPPLPSPGLLPALSGPGADLVQVLAVGQALGWTPPTRSRAAGELPTHPLCAALETIQAIRAAGRAADALTPWLAMVRQWPDFGAGWWLGVALAEEAGQPALAAKLRARASR